VKIWQIVAIIVVAWLLWPKKTTDVGRKFALDPEPEGKS